MKKILFILVIFMLNIILVKGQCPPSTTCTTTWTTVEHDMEELLDEPGFRASATFSYRVNCDGDFEFMIDNIDIINNSNYLDDFSIYHYNYSSITEKVALDYLLSSDAFGDDVDFPDVGSIKRIFVYTASCGIWLRCSYKLPNPIVKVCDTPWNGSDPHYPVGADKWVDHWRWHSCGDVCCKKEYTLARNIYGYREIQSKVKSRYSAGEECSLQGTFWGNRPNPTSGSVELPCEDGC